MFNKKRHSLKTKIETSINKFKIEIHKLCQTRFIKDKLKKSLKFKKKILFKCQIQI